VSLVARPESIFGRAYRTTTFGVLTVIAMIAFEAMAVGPALPSAARELHAVSAYGWLFTMALAPSVVGMVAAGQLSDARGPRLPLVAGVTAFLVGLVVAGTAQTMVQLVIARGVQGLGVGLTITAAYVVIGECYPPDLRPRVFAATASAWVLPSLLGPVLSGVLTEHVGWRWVFLALVPFVLLASLLLWPVLRQLHRTPLDVLPQRRRLISACVVAVGVTGVEAAGQHVSAAGLLGVLAGVAAVAWGIRPLVPIGTFRAAPGVAAPVAMRGLMSGAFFGIEAAIPLMLSVQHGYSALESGVPLTLAGLTWAVGSWWQGRTAGDDDPHRLRLAQCGYVFVAAAAVLVAVASQRQLSPWPVYLAWILAGAGAGLTMPASSVLLLRHTTDADRGADSAALQLTDTTCASLTTGLAGVLIAAAAGGGIAYGTAFALLDAAMLAVALFGVLAAHRAGAAR
jgi:MFS family permease